MKFINPAPLPFDLKEWKQKPFNERVRMLCEAWAVQGYGAPVAVYSFYLLKIAFYIGMWLYFCSFSADLGPSSEIGNWWFNTEALGKAILWSLLFENLGLGCGSGPLTARYLPPFAAAFHFLRPGTIKMPFFPGIKLSGSDKRSWFDVLLYSLHIIFLINALIAPELNPILFLPTVVLLPILGLTDKTIFLSARAEHYGVALLCFLFPIDTIASLKLLWFAIWFWAATSKLNRHFPSVIGVMVSNSAFLRIEAIRKLMYQDFPNDLRPSKLAVVLAHFGTVVEYSFPLLLIFGDGGPLSLIGLLIMFCFHLYITASIPMAVPLEWNFLMVYGAFVLFGYSPEISLLSINSNLLFSLLFLLLFIIPIAGNLFPKHFSFLSSMRYYAGNWAYSIWLFKGDKYLEMDDNIVKSSKTVLKQLAPFYDTDTAESLVAKVIGFRCMHLHGRLLPELVKKAVNNIEEYSWRDGELVAGTVLGWNFGEGHLHNEQLLLAVQKRCNYKEGELRCIFVESQPFGRAHWDWRIVDAKSGEISKGRTSVDSVINDKPAQF